ncbi:MAG TPA: HAMP domain-containing sensor histidine kinase [Sphingomonas sp.]|jgi:signal transduction histidine kinase
MTAQEIAHGLVDGDGRLVEAEDALLGLTMRAGGRLGEVLAVPQLATVARLARRLQVPITRSVVVADREADIELLVSARPDGDGTGGNVRLAVAGWRERRPWRPIDVPAALDLLAAGADWRWECDGALRLGFVSIDAGRIHGFDALGLLGRPLTEMFAFEADAGGGLPILDALAERRSFDAQPASVRSSRRAVLVSAVARRDAAGAFAGFAGAVSEMPASGSEAASVGATLGDRLEKALRAPLAQIIAGADSIHSESQGPVGSDYAAYAADIASAGRHLMALVDDLADLEAVERPDYRPDMERIDLADLARRAAGLLSVRAADGGVAIVRPEPGDSQPATGDFRRVLQILVNLIGNAVRYSPRGSAVTVYVGPGARVSVADAGKGIAPDDQGRIFDKFERIDTSEPGGSGLGLYIARRLARAMGGDLTVASAPGEGATFTLTLGS